VIRALCLQLMILLLVLVGAMGTGCEESRGSIEGWVVDENGEPVAEAIIRAERGGSPGILLRTDEGGYYNIKNVYAGKWDVEFYDEHGFGMGLESITVRGDETTRLDFTIGAKPPPSNMPRLINVPTGD
jgi:hypothetical protein